MLLFLIVLLALPLTISLLQSRVSTQEYSASKCITRPPCLDVEPRCVIPEPESGWCPKNGLPQGPTSVPGAGASSIPLTTTPSPAINTKMCSECIAHNEKYLCTNTKNNKQFCFATGIDAPGYSCVPCAGIK